MPEKAVGITADPTVTELGAALIQEGRVQGASVQVYLPVGQMAFGVGSHRSATFGRWFLDTPQLTA